MDNQSKIQCPECGTEINVNEILSHQLEEQFKRQYNSKLKEREDEIGDLKNRHENDLIELKKEVSKEIRSSLKKELESEQEDQIKSLREELDIKSEKVKELNASKAEIERLKREKDEAKSEAKLEAQKELNKILEKERIRLKNEAESSSEFKIKELEKKLHDQIVLTQKMKRKQEQGSMQLQGEVQELAIEDWLIAQFPLDTIEEIKKGATGADCLQIVNTREIQNCGTIYYESKRTKAFHPAWIEKFKNDIREKNANIGVLVTEVLPNGMDRMGLKDGIWICTFEEFKGLSAVLRQSIITISSAVISQENKGDKMIMLYAFLTSNEFKLQIEGIVEGFTQMQADLVKEKNAMKRIWKKREKQIDKVVTNTVHMYGSIKGIAGNAIQEIKLLELDG